MARMRRCNPAKRNNRGGDVSHVDWEKIKAEYLQGGTSYRKLANKHDVSRTTLEQRARKEEWTKQREDVQDKAAAKARQKIVSQRAKDIELLDKSLTLLIRKLHRSIEKFPDIPGNRMEQSVTELIGADDDSEDKPKKKVPKQKIVRFESDLMKMVTMLDKLMEISGYTTVDDADADDGFIDALNATALGAVNDIEIDTPEDVEQ